MDRLTKPTKRILYILCKNINCYLSDLAFGEKKDGQQKSLKILRRLSDKGLVTSRKSPLRGKNNPAVRSYYWLTDEGKVVADEIVKDIENEYNYYTKWV